MGERKKNKWTKNPQRKKKTGDEQRFVKRERNKERKRKAKRNDRRCGL